MQANQVRVVGDNSDNGIHNIREAIRMAEEMGVDLVEVVPNADPPVCKLVDYQKFLYEQKKKEKVALMKNSLLLILKQQK